MMTNAQLRQVMRYYLEHVNGTSRPVTDETVHRDLLSSGDGYGPASSARLYEGFVRYSLATVEHPVRDWPSRWLEMTVGELADVLVPRDASSAAGSGAQVLSMRTRARVTVSKD